MSVTDLAGKMRGYCEEIFEHALDDRLIDSNPVPPAKNVTSPNKKIKHHGAIEAARLPDLHDYILNCNYTAAFKACAISLIVSGLRVSNIALIDTSELSPCRSLLMCWGKMLSWTWLSVLRGAAAAGLSEYRAYK